jgi:molybdenum cofactor cytidylyltransferase
MTDAASPSKGSIAAVILAAGGSTRMGQPKLLLDWRGEPLIRWPVKTALKAGLSPVIVVTGAAAEAVERSLTGLEIELVHNPDWEKGQSTSVRSGIEALPDTVEAVIFLLGDQPQLPVSFLEKMIAAYRSNAQSFPIFISAFQGRRGNPVLFDKSVFQELRALEGDAGGRLIFSKHPLYLIPVEDPGMLLDIDSPEDYENLVKKGGDLSSDR